MHANSTHSCHNIRMKNKNMNLIMALKEKSWITKVKAIHPLGSIIYTRFHTNSSNNC